MSTASSQLVVRRPSWWMRPAALDRQRVGQMAPLGALLCLTAVLYLWGLSRNGDANQYYAAAVHAGTDSWKAFLFGSLDAANYITVDKPPASLWVMEVFTRVFGFSSFSMLLPQALEGVAAVGLLYAMVKRWFGRSPALLAGLILAITPIAALMFRFDNPDALLVLLLVLSAYGVTRALEQGSTRWLVFAGGALGFGFLTKELQAFLVLPAFAITYLVAAPVPPRRRLWQLAIAGVAIFLSAGWWVALVELWPASARPYIGDTTNNNILELIFGANGLDRLSSGGFGGAAGFSGPAGVLRLFNSELGGQIGWLVPAAGVALVSGIAWTARRPRTDRTRAALLLWGGWLVVSAAVFSFMTGVIHPYYTNTLAPAIAVLVGVGVTVLWQQRERLGARLILGIMLAGTAALSYALLDRAPAWHPWLRFAVLFGALASTVVTIAYGAECKRAALAVLAVTALAAGLAGPTAYALSSVASSQSGSNPTAGPASASGGGFPGGGRTAVGHQSVNAAVAALLEGGSSRYTWVAATSSAQTAAALELATGKSVMGIGGFSGSDPATTLAHFERLVAERKIHFYVSGIGPGGGFPGGGPPGSGPPGGGFPGGGPPGGFPGGGPPGSGPPGGGFRGGGGPPSGGLLGGGGPPGGGPPGGGLPGGGAPTGGGGPGGGANGVERQIQSWVQAHFSSHTVGGATVYDLTQPKASSR